jgi:hypothetical protein
MRILIPCLWCALLLLTGCASQVGTDAIGAGIGGAGAYALSDGNPLSTAAGAAAGIAVSEIAGAGARKNDATIARNNYDRGKSDAVKQQYWIIQNKQAKPQPERRTVRYEIPVPSTDPNINTVPNTRVLRVEE